jgi:hypothetical protein
MTGGCMPNVVWSSTAASIKLGAGSQSNPGEPGGHNHQLKAVVDNHGSDIRFDL